MYALPTSINTPTLLHVVVILPESPFSLFFQLQHSRFMEGEGSFKELLELMSSNFDVNHLPFGSTNAPAQHRLVTGDQITEYQPDLLPALPCIAGFPGSSSMPPPVSASHFVDWVPGFYGELSNNNPSIMPDSSSFNPSSTSDIWKLNAATCTLHHDSTYEAFMNVPKPYSEYESIGNFGQPQYLSNPQNQMVLEQESRKYTGNLPQIQPRPKVAPSVFVSKSNNKASLKKRAVATSDRQRRARISERLTAFKELLPNSVEGSQAIMYDDIIDHIKYLQLQIKELSRSKLGGESSAGSFVFLEGYGHYLVRDPMMNEPLEEIIGLLLEVNPSAANQLLESKGLYVMPIDLVNRL